MNDEIREAIMQFQTAIDFKEAPMPMNYSIDLENAKMLLNYITNLEQENEKLNRVIETLKETNHLLIHQKYKLEYELDALDNRVEKAVEYIKKDLSLGVNTFGSVYSIGANEVLNILQDGSEGK